MDIYSEDTFQMDEELPTDDGDELPANNCQQNQVIAENVRNEPVDRVDMVNMATKKHKIKIENNKDMHKDKDAQTYDKIIQKRFIHYNEVTTTEDEQEIKFDEDLDDKLDETLQKKLELEYSMSCRLDQPLTPPENFAPIINTIYRSSFPQPNNFSYLKTLKLKSILCLIPEDYPQLQLKFLEQENIQLFQLGMSGNKEPFVKISSDLITQAVKIVLNPKNHPILIHCNRGKHRTGCLVGVIRRLQNWSLTLIFDEYRKFAAPKERPMDLQFIELYDDSEIIKFAQDLNILPLKWDRDW